MAFALRPYQVEAIAESIDALRQHQRVLVCMPTGTGKTVVLSEIAARYAKAGHRVLVLAHRKELLDQAAGKLESASGIRPAIEQAARREGELDSPIIVASVQSMIGRLDRFGSDVFKLVIIDEAHRSLAPTYVELLEHFGCKTLGFTATPNRGDEKALAQVYGAVGYDYTLADAISAGWLTPPRVVTIETPSLDLRTVRQRSGELMAGDLGRALSEVSVLREAVGPALEHAWQSKALVFCATRAHMACVRTCIEEMVEDRGLELTVDAVDGTTPSDERDAIFARFRASKRRHWLLNIDVATEGFDDPGVEALVLLRPTLSRARYMQMVGRGLRPLSGIVDGLDVEATLADAAPSRLPKAAGLDRPALARRVAIATSSKPSCLILDFAGNSDRHELASPIDLLGGDFDPVEKAEAQRLADAGLAEDLWAALEQARAQRAAKQDERRARHGDPFALVGIPLPPRDRFGRKPTPKQAAVIAALRQPRRIEDYREASALIRELARRDQAGLALYSQAALLARLGCPLAELRELPRRKAAGIIRQIEATDWRRPR